MKRKGSIRCALFLVFFAGWAFHETVYAQTNLALTASASASTEQSNHLASAAKDNNATTRWCASSAATGAWLKLDFGSNKKIDSTQTMWEFSGIYKYKIETSTDNSSWTLRVDKTTNTVSKQTFSDIFSVASARYVRITATGLPTGAWASIFEFRVFGQCLCHPLHHHSLRGFQRIDHSLRNRYRFGRI